MTKRKKTEEKPQPVVAIDKSETLARGDMEALEDSLDPTLEPMGKATAEVRHEARCLVCGNVTNRAICPVDGNRMGD